MTLFNLYIYSYANIKLQICSQKVLMHDIKVKCVCWLWFTGGYINDAVEQFQYTVHSHYICVIIGLKWKEKVIIFDPLRSRMIYCDGNGWWWLVTAKRVTLLRLVSDEREYIHKGLVYWMVLKIVIKGLLSDHG
jgi:hypothetical protein